VSIFILVVMIGGIWSVILFSGSVSSGPIPRQMKAIVKGSIYETGEMMSVFGTCMDYNDIPIENSTAILSAYYPNGSVWFENDTMMEISNGYFVWAGPMDTVGGTYLTEFTCFGLGQQAKAFGEWQNPVWVARIASIMQSLNETQYLLYGLNGSIVGVNATLSQLISLVENSTQANEYYFNYLTANGTVSLYDVLNQVNINYDLINATYQEIQFLSESMVNNFTYTNSLITQVGDIANASVDRNDSLIVTLINNLINLTSSQIVTPSNLTYIVVSQDVPRYWRDWNIVIRAYDSNGRLRSSPEIYCIMTTTTNPTPTYMEESGINFRYSEFINQFGDFQYTISCGFW